MDQTMRPSWNPNRREVKVGDALIKRFRQPSANQERLIKEFHDLDWPERIVDPLPHNPRIDPKRRLRDTVHCLNIHQVTKDLLHFGMDGTGEGVLWEVR
jgi:hypothetical protein